MREGWDTAKLADVCQMIKRGVTPKYIEDGGVCVINQKCVRDHVINYELARRHDIERKTVSEERYIKVGDILVNSTGTGTLGRVAQIRQEPPELTTVDTHVTIVRPTPGKFFEDFFGYMLVKIEDEITLSGEGVSGQTELARTTLENKFDVSYPRSISEQKQIVAILDEAFAGIDKAIANTQQNLANARELFESYLNTIFTQKGEGWVEKPLGNVCDFLNGFAFKSKDSVQSSNIQLIRMGNLYQNNLDLDRKPSFYPSNYKEEYSRYVLSEGDLIMSLTGTVDKEDYGFTVEIPKTERVLLLNQRIVKFINIREDLIDRKYFLYCLKSKYFLEKLYKSARGTRQANLSSVSMKELPIYFPNMDKQRCLVQKFNSLESDKENLETICQQKLAALTELKQALLQKAFSGELTADELPIKKEAAA